MHFNHIILGRMDTSKKPQRIRKSTHCPKGHPYDGENLYFGSQGERRCRMCHRASQKKYQLKKKPRC